MGPLVDKWEFQLDQSEQIDMECGCVRNAFKILREITKGHRPGSL